MDLQKNIVSHSTSLAGLVELSMHNFMTVMSNVNARSEKVIQ